MLEVVDPGFLTTVQDAGRPGWAHLGVPVAGPCDRWSHAVANLLAGNDPGDAALELTVVGGSFLVREPCVVALAGADLGGRVVDGEGLRTGGVYRLEAGARIEFPGGEARGSGAGGDAGASRDAGGSGARGYLALAGGIDVPAVLGSRATCLAGGFGGLDGRALRSGDLVTPRRRGDLKAAGRSWPGPAVPAVAEPVRVLAGPSAEQDGRAALDALVAVGWKVGSASDRVGLRLEGPALPGPGRETLSHGVPWGAVQLPPDGGPIVLLADHGVTGGYPVPAVVASADHPRLGQLRPGDRVRFAVATQDEARLALRAERRALEEGVAAMREGAAWDELWRSMGG